MSSGSELWIGCARWLRDLNVLTTDKNGTIVEFASILRDGILLCRLANTLVPNAINQNDIIKAQQQTQFTCTRNIRLFVNFCKSHFKMQDSDLFNPEKLYHMDGFQQILKTLSILSHTDESIRRGVNPFPETTTSQESSSCSPCLDFNDDEDIYQSLPKDIDSVNPDETIYGPITSAEEKQNEQVYDRIVTNRKPSMNENDLKTSSSNIKDLRVKELYDTEVNYVRSALGQLIDIFYKPLKEIISTEQFKTVFANIEPIHKFHVSLLADLEYPVNFTWGISEEKVPRPTTLNGIEAPRTIGEVFVKYRDQFLIYGKYCSNLLDSREMINSLLNTNEKFAKLVNESAQQAGCKFSLNDLLCVPFQRITKYPLLLKELLKKCDMSSPDRKSLAEAVEVMEDVCNYINEESRDTTSKKMIDEIEKSIVDLAMPENVKLHDYGRVNFDGEVKMSESTATTYGKAKQRYVFLFDKVIVVCKTMTKMPVKEKSPSGSNLKSNTFTYKNAYIMSELNIDQNVSIDTKSGGTITRRTQYVIHMHRDRNEGSEITQISFYFKNEATRSAWMTALLLSKSNVSPTEYLRDTNHKVSFHSLRVDLEKPYTCGVCEKLMKGLRYQGYKCESCEMIMHKDCLGLKKCEAIRRSTHEHRSSHSFNISRPRLTVREGDVVTASSTVIPQDLSYLQFTKGDTIEVIKMQSHNRFTGCVSNNRNRTGLVHLDHISKPRTTSMIGLSPMESPAGSIVRIGRHESTVLPNKPLSDPSARSSDPQLSRTSRTSSTSTVNGNNENGRPQEYVNTEIAGFRWYMGEMERTKAESTLRGTPNGTFLVRYSKNRKQTAISLSYKNDVKHMIIEKNQDGKMYLDEDYIFNSTVELVQYYRDHNLIEIFQALDTCLKVPYSACKVYKAVHDYDPPSPNSDGKFLSFKTGDTVVLLDTVGEDRGWWKGQVNNKTGFFPLSYVKALESISDDNGPSTPTSSSS
ncbi:hypothetical protein GCK72_023266 [Caenorhabditis remanei]|uniref:Uncharacterized protein n=1 Tax=Caenorhabditis remanei TaxID=31234 RepID=A0A6A5FW02_CAERE|nr:hypothetical protein GCK72_023266 [Caenorhabditis remanei]KAF1746808.1 hypothetical protein GCK72_023266 [Caenorhabditis remanei]